MKVIFLSVHSVLEYQEMRILTELDSFYPQKPLDIEVFSLGAYSNPTQSGDYLRSIIPKGRFYPELYGLAMQSDKDNLQPELVQWADVVIMHHNAAVPGQSERQRWLERNWPMFEKYKKKVGWRSIGQSTPEIEETLAKYRGRGMNIIRMSPHERRLPNYAGEDAMIRFSESGEEFKGWNGAKKQIIIVAQSFKRRGDHLGYYLVERIAHGFNYRIYGTGNEDLGPVWGGVLSYEGLKQELRDARLFLYFGTKPVPYTLSFLEALMTGIPVVAIGPKLREDNVRPYGWHNYEVHHLITNGVNGYVSDNIDDLRGYIQLLLDNDEVAKRIGAAGRRTALELFGREKANKEWYEFLTRI